MGFVKAAEISEIPVGKMKMIKIHGKPILIANVDGRHYAIGARCTHRGADLSKGTLRKNVVSCPRHNAKFDLTTGDVISGPAHKDKQSYRVKIEGNDILIEIA
jgi:nitrite reductase/ring-hydroxylating ferredoxin subunit